MFRTNTFLLGNMRDSTSKFAPSPVVCTTPTVQFSRSTTMTAAAAATSYCHEVFLPHGPWSTPRQTRSGRHAMTATNTPCQEGTHRLQNQKAAFFVPTDLKFWTPNDAFQTPNLFANPVSSATRTPPSRTSAHLNVLGSQDRPPGCRSHRLL